MIPRTIQAELDACRREYAVLAVTGPRQSGKTTLARQALPERPYVSFEDPLVRERFREDPKGLLHDCRDGAVFDEVQRVPELFSFLQGMVDERPEPGRFVVTGSQNLGLLAGVSQSLAGRVALLELLPFSADELSAGGWLTDDLDEALFAGSFPPVFDRSLRPRRWYADYAATYLERDVRQITQVHDLGTFTRFLRLCAGSVGQLFNASRLGADCGVDHKTIRKWLSVLEASYVVFLAQPYHATPGKRVIKTPKLYLADTGLACHLLGIQEPRQVATHPLRGALFENWVFAETLKHLRNQGSRQPVYFWRTHGGQEIDLLIEEGGDLVGIEAKSGMTVRPEAGRLLQAALAEWEHLQTQGVIVYAGTEPATLAGCRLVPWQALGRFWAQNAQRWEGRETA